MQCTVAFAVKNAHLTVPAAAGAQSTRLFEADTVLNFDKTFCSVCVFQPWTQVHGSTVCRQVCPAMFCVTLQVSHTLSGCHAYRAPLQWAAAGPQLAPVPSGVPEQAPRSHLAKKSHPSLSKLYCCGLGVSLTEAQIRRRHYTSHAISHDQAVREPLSLQARAATTRSPCLGALIICGHAAGAASPGVAKSSASADAADAGASALPTAHT